ncbi:MAG: thioredoxin [Pseudomonadales bacterium RIFCSPLOWO2_12_59_9]|uniref:thioredoxin family protein n=1 Tax=Pseudomonas sp. TaxID=306 RepID=UPI0008B8EA67|nr:MAG: thioredoxin [Pseudomonadales bacterium RIFCSPLOWO2_12_59_9]
MTTDSKCHQTDITQSIIATELQLTDFNADRQLLDLFGTSLLIFTSIGCASCRWARREIPNFALPVARLCWIDAGDNGGLVQRYEVRQLPAFFVVKDSQYFGSIAPSLSGPELLNALQQALTRAPEELP